MSTFLQLRKLGPNPLPVRVDGTSVKVMGDKDAPTEPFLYVMVLGKDGPFGEYKSISGTTDLPVVFVWPKSNSRGEAYAWDNTDRPDEYHLQVHETTIKDKGKEWIKKVELVSTSRVESIAKASSQGPNALFLRIAEKMFTDLVQIQQLDERLSELSHIVKTNETPRSTSDIIELGTKVPMVMKRTIDRYTLVGPFQFPSATLIAGLTFVAFNSAVRFDSTVLKILWKNIDDVEDAAKTFPGSIILVPYEDGAALETIKQLAAKNLIQAQAVPAAARGDVGLLGQMVSAVLGRMQRSRGASLRVASERTIEEVLKEAGEAASNLEFEVTSDYEE